MHPVHYLRTDVRLIIAMFVHGSITFLILMFYSLKVENSYTKFMIFPNAVNQNRVVAKKGVGIKRFIVANCLAYVRSSCASFLVNQ